MGYLLLAPLRSTLDVGALFIGAPILLTLTEDEMNDLDDDLFDDGMIVSAGDVIPEPVVPVEQITVVGENYEDADTGIDPWSSIVGKNEPDGLEEPGLANQIQASPRRSTGEYENIDH